MKQTANPPRPLGASPNVRRPRVAISRLSVNYKTAAIHDDSPRNEKEIVNAESDQKPV